MCPSLLQLHDNEWRGAVVFESEHGLSCNLRVAIACSHMSEDSVTLRVNERQGVPLPWDSFIT